SWGDVHDLASLARLATRQDYGGPFSPSRQAGQGQLLERLDAFAGATFSSFGAVGTLLAVVGALATWRRDRRTAVAIALAALATGPAFAAANAFDIHSPYRVAF